MRTVGAGLLLLVSALGCSFNSGGLDGMELMVGEDNKTSSTDADDDDTALATSTGGAEGAESTGDPVDEDIPPESTTTTGAMETTGTGDESTGSDEDTESGTSTEGGDESTSGALPPQSLPQLDCGQESMLESESSGASATIAFYNASNEIRQLFWINYGGQRVHYDTFGPTETSFRTTHETHPWVLTDGSGDCVTIFMTMAGDHNINVY